MTIKVIGFDLFGVLYKDLYKALIKERATELKEFVEIPTPPFVFELGLSPCYPQYYFDLVHINERFPNLISDAQFYSVLSTASGISKEELKNIIHDTSPIDIFVFNLIKTLKASDYKISIFANVDNLLAEEFLSKHELPKYIDFIITPEKVGENLSKMDVNFYTQAAKLMGYEEESIVYIDDSEKYKVLAEQAGMKSCIYDSENVQGLISCLEQNGVTFNYFFESSIFS